MFGQKGKIEDKQPDLEFFTVFDTKSKSYGTPVHCVNKHVLIRDVVNMFKTPEREKNVHYTNAEDFAIFKIGAYDKSQGLILSQNQEHIANMHDLRAMAQQDTGIVPT